MIAQSRAKSARCITPGCDNLPHIRGLCPACYISARRLVRDSKTTWDDLVAMGLALAARNGHGHPGLFLRTFLAQRTERGKKQSRPKRRAKA